MDPQLFLRDLERAPAALLSLREALSSADPWAEALTAAPRRIVLVGMGSSHFANSVLAQRLQAGGVAATAVLASTEPLPAVEPTDVVIVVSASGGSVESVAAALHYAGRCRTIAMTNKDASVIEDLCDARVAMIAGEEAGGVACRSFQHTLALHLALADRILATSTVTPALQGAAAACDDLLDRSSGWLPRVSELLLGPDGTTVVAPARRLSSAQQGALMMREGPRRPAIACETGDWSHIDVYLTKTTDYRMLLLPGSSWESQLWDWTTQRGSTVVVAGADAAQAAFALRYAHDEEDDVRLLAEIMVPSLVAAGAWAAQG